MIGTGSKTTTEVLMLPMDDPEGSNSGRSFRARQDVEYDVSFAVSKVPANMVRIFRSPWSITMR